MVGLQELKDWLKASDSEDDLLTALESRAVAFLQTQTGRYFGVTAQVTEHLEGRESGDLWLTDTPADPGAITEVVERAHAGDDGTTITAADDDGFIPRETRLVRKGGLVWCRGYEYEVPYSRGYPADSAEPPDPGKLQGPEDIRQAVLDLVALKYRGRGHEATQSESIGGYSYRVGDVELIPGLQETIDAWAWVGVG